MSLEGINRDASEVIDVKLYSSPEVAHELLELKKQNPEYPYHQKSATQERLTSEYNLPESASLEEVLRAEDLVWRRSIEGPITGEDSEEHRQKIIELHQKIIKERRFPEETTVLDVISAEKEVGGYVMRMGKWVSEEEAESIDKEAGRDK